MGVELGPQPQSIGASAGSVTATPSGGLAGDTVEEQLIELDTEKASTDHNATHEVGGSDPFTGIVPASAFAPAGLTGAVTATRYVGGTASGPPASGTFVAGDFVVTAAGSIWICTTGGTPGTWKLAGTPWNPPPTRKASNETVNNSDGLQDDDALLFAIAANEVWVAKFVLFVSGDTTADFAFGITVPGGASLIYAAAAVGLTGSNFAISGLSTASAGEINTGAVTANGGSPVIIEAYVANGATPGNVTLQWAQSVQTVANTTVLAGSNVTPRRVA